VIVERVEHPVWLSNAYLVADRASGHGVLVDSNGLAEPLLRRIRDDAIEITHVLVTHHHEDHVVDIAELAGQLRVPIVGSELTRDAGITVDETISDGDVVRSGDLEIRAIATPGHCLDHTAFLVNGTDCVTADCLFKGTAERSAAARRASKTRCTRSCNDYSRFAQKRGSTPVTMNRARSVTSGRPTPSFVSGADSSPRETSRAASEARRRHSSCSVLTTTGLTKPGCVTWMAEMRSSGARRSSEARVGGNCQGTLRYPRCGHARSVRGSGGKPRRLFRLASI
jgi:Metallo-beta-lactamase superfamily